MREALRDLTRIVRLVRPFWGSLAKGTGLSAIIALVGLIPPYFTKQLFDSVYPAQDVSLLTVLVIATLTLAMTIALMNAVRNFYGTSISAHLTRSVSLMYFNYLQHLTVRFFDEHRVGEVNSRFGNVISSVTTVTRMFETVILNSIFLLFIPPLLFVMNPTLALLSLISVPLTTIVSAVSSRWVRRLSQQSQVASAELSAFQIETLAHVRLVKSMAAEPFVFRSAREQIQETMELQLKSAALGLSVGIVNSLLAAIGTAVFSYFAWIQIIHQELSLGDFMAFSMYIGYLVTPIGSFASLFLDFQNSAVSFARMFEYLDQPVEQNPVLSFWPQPPIARRLNGEIEFERVSFGYSGGKNVLQDFSIHLPRGSVTAVVGPSGAGKSSMLRLICAIERPDHGDIRFDGIPAREISLADLRRQVATISQDVGLMRGTLRENLTYALGEVPQARIDEVVGACQLRELVTELPSGLESTVAEWGATLSGGQRQRLAIARALLRDAPILLLDEATSNIDLAAEAQILREVFLMMRGKTVVFVTHRVATAQVADRIVVLAGGRLVGIGSHEELLAVNTEYRAMHAAGTASSVERFS